MDAFVSRKRRRPSPPDGRPDRSSGPLVKDGSAVGHGVIENSPREGEDSTELKLACLASLHPELGQDALLDVLLACDGSVETASEHLIRCFLPSPRKVARTVGYQSSLRSLVKTGDSSKDGSTIKPLTRKGQTLFLYSPQDVETQTPCSIIHNFLSAAEADALLAELLEEAKTFQRDTFQLFDRTVESPHSMSFFVDGLQQMQDQRTSYVYNGSRITDIRQTPARMLDVSAKVAGAVNAEIQRRIKDYYPGGKKLRFQSAEAWKPNTAFVNCYDGPHESVGYHSDQLTYLGPRAVIGSLSLGVAREFRVRRIVPSAGPGDRTAADTQGQISIHLPHNSLLVMHAEMQETWKHAIAPATAIDPHPIAGNKRINVTYRYYKASLHPRFTPKCHCGVATVLRCVQKKAENLGKYMWMCHAGYTPGQTGCSFFKWAEFDDDGEPPWRDKVASI
ncbi:hypothetical protein MBLNU459_g2735t1 [Dothideomycetes sp. NU459]